MGGSLSGLVRFARLNESVLDRFPAGERLRRSLIAMLSALTTPGADPVKQLESRLAVLAVILTSFPALFGPDLSQEERTAAAMQVATKLVSD